MRRLHGAPAMFPRAAEVLADTHVECARNSKNGDYGDHQANVQSLD